MPRANTRANLPKINVTGTRVQRANLELLETPNSPRQRVKTAFPACIRISWDRRRAREQFARAVGTTTRALVGFDCPPQLPCACSSTTRATSLHASTKSRGAEGHAYEMCVHGPISLSKVCFGSQVHMNVVSVRTKKTSGIPCDN